MERDYLLRKEEEKKKRSSAFSRAAITQMELMGYVMAPHGTILKSPDEA